MARLFDTETGKAVVIALDHGLALGAPESFEDPAATLRRVLAGDPDAVIVGPHFARRYADVLTAAETKSVVTADSVMFSTIPGETEAADLWRQTFDVETLHAADPVAVKMVLVFGREDRAMFMDNVHAVARLASELDVPLAVEPVMWGKRVESETDPALVTHGARIAWEHGADVLKIPYTGDPESFGKIVDHSPVPVMMLGGPAKGTVEGLLREVSEAIEAGARGVMIGRRAWQLEEPAAVVDALNQVVHGGRDPEAAWP
jgi:DhnA family fructose-bisphosphate aldolase class Ia